MSARSSDSSTSPVPAELCSLRSSPPVTSRPPPLPACRGAPPPADPLRHRRRGRTDHGSRRGGHGAADDAGARTRRRLPGQRRPLSGILLHDPDRSLTELRVVLPSCLWPHHLSQGMPPRFAGMPGLANAPAPRRDLTGSSDSWQRGRLRGDRLLLGPFSSESSCIRLLPGCEEVSGSLILDLRVAAVQSRAPGASSRGAQPGPRRPGGIGC